MTSEKYQELAKRTLPEKPLVPLTNEELMMVWHSMGLAGEAGEFLDDIKKVVFHGHPLNSQKLIKELADCLWYLTTLSNALDFTLEEVMNIGIIKSEIRYPNGFTIEDSIKRIDTNLEQL